MCILLFDRLFRFHRLNSNFHKVFVAEVNSSSMNQIYESSSQEIKLINNKFGWNSVVFYSIDITDFWKCFEQKMLPPNLQLTITGSRV